MLLGSEAPNSDRAWSPKNHIKDVPLSSYTCGDAEGLIGRLAITLDGTI